MQLCQVFIVISSFMMLNMLLGILVEVVASTAEGWIPFSSDFERAHCYYYYYCCYYYYYCCYYYYY